ncbi:MAG: 7-carboxy-7-deazaguanine synthase QueE [Cyclobacteriaceae bacterium]|nr:7-carboxy-7-deazaguanine synthase QueE [Cyclobacteriaceae bacterium]
MHTVIPVMESFLTLQGEGYHTGRLAYFIRTGGCDVGCHWCDVKESWEAASHVGMTVDEILEAVKKVEADRIVITGGEPLMYDMDVLTMALKGGNKKTHLETSGVYPLSGEWDWICFSPKKFKEAKEEFYRKSDELKVVIYHESDLAWADRQADKMHGEALLFLQPEWSRKDRIMPLIVEHIKSNPRWRVSLQTHKYLDIP